MRSEMISFCLLWIILKPSLSVSDNDALVFRYTESFKFFHYKDLVTEENQHYGFVVEHNSSSIIVEIKLFGHPQNKLVGTLVRYRDFARISPQPILEWNEDAGYYVAEEVYSRIKDVGIVGHPTYRQSASPSMEESIVVGNLHFPDTDYFLEIESYRENNIRNKATVLARTKAAQPIAPHTGAGCFHIYNTSEDGTRRNIKIYWQLIEDFTTRYEALGYEIHSKSASQVFGREGFLKEGFIRTDISSSAHTFIFRTFNDAGYSIFTTVKIPAQKDIIPAEALSTLVSYNNETNTFVLTWKMRFNVHPISYTVFWYYTRDDDGGVEFVRDFVYLDRDAKRFEVKTDRLVRLAISFNTNTKSTGLQPAVYDKNDTWTID